MRIPVEGIPAAGRRIDFARRDGWAAEAAARSLDRAADGLEGFMNLSFASKRAGLVRVEGEVRTQSMVDCDRCGEDCVLALDERFTLLYGPEETGSDAFDGGELELQVDDLDLGWYRNGQVDLADVLREALALSLPARVVCADQGECDMRTRALLAASAAKPGHPAFAALEALRSTPEDAG